MSKTVRKKSLTIALPPEQIAWLESMVESKDFASLSHGVEYCIHQVMTKKAAESRDPQD